MEQTVWLYFGIVTVVLAFGVIGNLVVNHKAQQKYGIFERALERLEGQCNFVCSSASSTLLSAEVELPSGIVLYTDQNLICGAYKDKKRCVRCNCQLREYTLNLNTTIAIQTFETHEYSCEFLREQDDIILECKG